MLQVTVHTFWNHTSTNGGKIWFWFLKFLDSSRLLNKRRKGKRSGRPKQRYMVTGHVNKGPGKHNKWKERFLIKYILIILTYRCTWLSKLNFLKLIFLQTSSGRFCKNIVSKTSELCFQNKAWQPVKSRVKIWFEKHNYKQTNKQTNKQTISYCTIVSFSPTCSLLLPW